MFQLRQADIIRAIFLLGMVCLLVPIAAFVLSEWENNPLRMDVEDAIVRASEGINANAAPPLQDMQILEAEAAKGNAVAQNNLALILRRSRGRDNRERSDALLEAAAEQGLPQAAYNVAIHLPHRWDTEPGIIQRQLDLLTPLAASGDPHAAAQLGRFLYYRNRSDYLPNSKHTQIEMFHLAAQSDDPEYAYVYADALLELARGEYTHLFPQAAEALLVAHEMGEPRAAKAIAGAIYMGEDWVAPVLEHTEYGNDPLAWLDHAARSGMRTAACSYALRVLRPIDRLDDDLEIGDLTRRLSDLRLAVDPTVFERAEAHLVTCYTPSRARRVGRSNPAFGEPALYAKKYRGTWSSLANSPGYARVASGVIAGFSPFDIWDPNAARAHFRAARDDGDLPVAVALIDLLEARVAQCLTLTAQRAQEEPDPAEEQDQDHQQVKDIQCGEL